MAGQQSAEPTSAVADGGRARRGVPRPGWLLVVVILLVAVGVLFVEAYVNAEFSPDSEHPQATQRTVPQGILAGGPIINATGGQIQSYRLSSRVIALTFDDGPDPIWTPRILALLRAHQVKATFFVIGAQVARHPGLVRRMVAEGHELGVHTFTHPDLAKLSAWQRRMEYSHTQLAIAGAAGIHTSLLRFPYSSRADAIDDVNWPLIREAGEWGYLTVVNNTDSQDWSRPGVAAIVANSIPPGYSGAVSLWHDAGGDRSQTLAALGDFILTMKTRGYRFATVTGALNIALADSRVSQRVAGHTPVSGVDRWRGGVVVWAVRVADGVLVTLAVLFVVVGVLTIGRTVLLVLLAGRQARRRRSRGWSWGLPVTVPVSVIVPAFNEAKSVAAAVRSLAGGDYRGAVEVIVVDDGSTDGTAEVVAGLGLPNVEVVRKSNRGKASALNTGVRLASHDVIVMVDADTVVEVDSIRRLVQPFADLRVGAVAGNVKVGNRRGLVGRWQHIEYVIGFSLDRRFYEALGFMPTVPGAIGAFRRAVLTDVGGVSGDTLAEDTDVTMAVCRAGWAVVYEESARAWTEAPATFGQLWKQRYRWSYGTMQAMWKHRRAVVERGASGRFGRRGLPLLVLFGVLLPLFAPVIDVLAVYGLFFLDRVETVLAWLLMLGLQVFTAVVAFWLDRERFGPLWALPLQQFVYRQLMYVVLIQALVTALTGGWLGWQKLRRTGKTRVPRPRRDAAAGAEGVRVV